MTFNQNEHFPCEFVNCVRNMLHTTHSNGKCVALCEQFIFAFLYYPLILPSCCHECRQHILMVHHIKKSRMSRKVSFKTKIHTHRKLNDVSYNRLELQPYMTSQKLSNKEKQLLYKLRSKCHESKMNFKKMNRNNLQWVFGCFSNEDQEHSFVHCTPIVSKIAGASMHIYLVPLMSKSVL